MPSPSSAKGCACNGTKTSCAVTQRVDRELFQRRQAVDEHIIVSADYFFEGAGEPLFAPHHGEHFHFSAGKIDVAADEAQIFPGRRHDEARGIDVGIGQQFVNRFGQISRALAQPDGEIGLRIEIDEQDFFATVRQRRAQVQRGGRFADAAFLIQYTNDTRHAAVLRSGFGLDAPVYSVPVSRKSAIARRSVKNPASDARQLGALHDPARKAGSSRVRQSRAG